VSHAPQRIVSLQPSITVTLARLGALDRVVACTKYCADVCPGLEQKLIVHDSWTVRAEELLAAGADLVIASVPYQVESVAEILKAGIPFLAFAPHSLADIYKDIALLAGIIGEPVRGEQVIAELQREIAEVAAKTRDLPRPLVYCEEWGKPLIHSQHWVAELVECAGGRFLGAPGKHTDAAAIAAAAPDVIIAAWCGAGDRVPLEKIMEQRGWQQTPAARERRVYCVNDELLNTPAPTLIGGLHALAAAIHPEHFSCERGLRRIR